MKRRKVVTGAGIIAAGLFAIVASLVWQLQEPSYGGKTLSDWLAGRWGTNSTSGLQVSNDVDEAIQKIGTNGIPTLLRMIEADDFTLKNRLMRLISRKYRDAGYLKADAMHAFRMLGTNAASAVPDLIRIYQNADRNPALNTRGCPAMSLGYIGAPAREAVPILLKDFNDMNPHVRYDAVLAVRKIGGDPAVVIPALRAVLQTTAKLDANEVGIRWVAAEALGEFGRGAEEAVPDLLANFDLAGEAEDPRHFELQIAKALWRIAPERVPHTFLKENENFEREMQWETNPEMPHL